MKTRRSSNMLAKCMSRMQHLYTYLRSGLWDGATPYDFVLLHGWCGKCVWGEWPWECREHSDIMRQAKHAQIFMRDALGDDPYQMAAYLRWAWLREKEKKDAGTINKTELSCRALFVDIAMIQTYRRYIVANAKEKRLAMGQALGVAI